MSPSNKEQPKSTQWVMFCDRKPLASSKASFFTLPHPVNKKEGRYLLSEDGKHIFEVRTFQPDFGAMFINNSVQEDKRMFLSTRFDPIFLLIPLLRKLLAKKSVFMTLEQILSSGDHDGYSHLSNLEIKDLSLICETKSIGDGEFAYKICEQKLFEWQKKKITKISQAALQKGLRYGASSSSTLNSVKDQNETVSLSHISYAIDVFGEYIDRKDIEKLKTEYKITKIQKVVEEEKAEKRTLSETPLEDYTKNYKVVPAPKKTKMSNAHSKLAKVDKKGMKPMTSFFTKKVTKSQ